MNRIALILSFIYCGFGQLYKRELMKGIDFIIIYTLLILSFFFYPHPFLLHVSVLFALIFMWILGMLDAYLDDKFITKGIFWLKLMDIFSGAVISGVIITLAIVSMQILPSRNNENTNVKTASNAKSIDNTTANTDDLNKLEVQVVVDPRKSIITNKVEENANSPAINQSEKNKVEESKVEAPVNQPSVEIGTENPTIQLKADTQVQQISQSVEPSNPIQIKENNSEKSQSERYFSIQVGAFSSKSGAESLAERLRKKNYPVEIIDPSVNESSMLYKVRVGKFETKDNAKKTAKELENAQLNIKAMILSF